MEGCSVQNVAQVAGRPMNVAFGSTLAGIVKLRSGDFGFMDTHGATTSVAHADHDHPVPESGERFEKSELTYFVDEDTTAGQNIGKLLAGVFLISFVLMTGVCVWMLNNASEGHDPQAGIGAEAHAEGTHH